MQHFFLRVFLAFSRVRCCRRLLQSVLIVVVSPFVVVFSSSLSSFCRHCRRFVVYRHLHSPKFCLPIVVVIVTFVPIVLKIPLVFKKHVRHARKIHDRAVQLKSRVRTIWSWFSNNDDAAFLFSYFIRQCWLHPFVFGWPHALAATAGSASFGDKAVVFSCSQNLSRVSRETFEGSCCYGLVDDDAIFVIVWCSMLVYSAVWVLQQYLHFLPIPYTLV